MKISYWLLCGLMAAMTPALVVPTHAAFAKTQSKAPGKKIAPTVKITKQKRISKPKTTPVAANSNERYSALVVDAKTGRVLYEKNAGETRYPASLTKMMTLYLTFDALKTGKLSLGEALPVSAKAASQPQTNLSLKQGMKVDVKTLIESLVVRSANDSAMVLAERLGGTEWNFALMMTQKARELGMENTIFRNPNGLPDDKQYTSAFDMARLGIALRRDFPQQYHYFSDTSFNFNGKTYTGHNRLLGTYAGADGIKTGFIRASGFNLVTSVKRGNQQLVAVVMGGHERQRARCGYATHSGPYVCELEQ